MGTGRSAGPIGLDRLVGCRVGFMKFARTYMHTYVSRDARPAQRHSRYKHWLWRTYMCLQRSPLSPQSRPLQSRADCTVVRNTVMMGDTTGCTEKVTVVTSRWSVSKEHSRKGHLSVCASNSQTEDYAPTFDEARNCHWTQQIAGPSTNARNWQKFILPWAATGVALK